MTPERIHELNKIAGEFCEIKLFEDGRYLTIVGAKGGHALWSPATNYNQMAEVKAKLREKKYFYECFWGGLKHHANIKDADSATDVWGHHESEALAFVLAVEELRRTTK